MTENINVLLVDDNIDQLQLTRIALLKSETHFTVDAAESAEMGLEFLANNKYDVIFLDYSLPDINGIEMLGKIRDKGVTAPVVFVTGHGNEKVAVKALKSTAYDYIMKEAGYLKVLPNIAKNAFEHARLERELEISRQRFQYLFQHAKDAILILSIETQNILETNTSAQNLFGLMEQELIGKSLLDLCVPDEHMQLGRVLDSLETADAQIIECVRMRKARTSSTWEGEIAISKIPVGNGFVMQCIIRDVTEKKSLERQIKKSNSQLEALFDGIRDMISVQDQDFNVVMANNRFAHWAGVPVKDLIGKKCYSLFFERESPCDECPLEDTLKTQKDHFTEMQCRDEILHVWSYPMPGQFGEPDYAIEHIRVVTEQKRLEDQLIQSERMATIGILSSGIAHELRNPLNIIEAARYYMAETIPAEDENLHSKLGIIKVNIQRSSRIIGNLLEFSRKSEAERQHVDVNKLLESTIGLVEKELRVQSVHISRDIAPDVCGEYNVDALRHIFLNLILNAMQAMPDGGMLHISTGAGEDGKTVISFKDTGTGISKENIKQIFSPFFTTKPVGEGTGLGLYIVNSLVSQQNGEIAVESVAGEGSTFKVSLPA